MCSYILFLCLCFLECQAIEVVVTPKFKKGEAPAEAFTSFQNFSSQPLSAISACHWTAFETEDLGSVWATRNTFFGNSLRRDSKSMYVGRVVIRFKYPSTFLFKPEKWMFFCFSYDNLNKEIKVYVNGKNVLQKIVKDHLDNFEIEKNFLQNEKFGKASQFSGKFSDLNIWSNIMSIKDFDTLYKCEEIDMEPDVLKWNNKDLVTGPNISVEEWHEHPCHIEKKTQPSIVAYGNFTMEPKARALRMCGALGGSINLPENIFELLTLGEQLANFSAYCNYFWSPIFKGAIDGTFLNSNNNPVKYHRWRKGQPNGGQDDEKCVSIAGTGTEGIAYFDTHCNKLRCFYCNISDFGLFWLKGLCMMEDSKILDTQYVLRPMTTHPVWKGVSSSQISWNREYQHWELFNRYDKTLIASTKSEFPFGENIWQLKAENICRDQKKRQELLLMFSKCSKSEYSCSDGSCVPITSKCNYVPDCWDGEDEDNCEILHLETMENYDSSSPDIGFDKAGNIEKKHVEVSSNITSIEGINEVKSRFTVSLIISLRWTDSRLTWKNLNCDASLNFPSSKEKHSLWFPKIIFENTENHLEVPNDSNAKFVIEKKGTPRMSDEYERRETAYFDGFENPILFSRELQMRLKCAFQLNYFPFDTQICSVVMVPGYKERNFIKLIGDSVYFSGKKQVLTFEVIDTKIKTGDTNIEVKIYLKRQISQYLLGIYGPSLLIMVAAQVCNKQCTSSNI